MFCNYFCVCLFATSLLEVSPLIGADTELVDIEARAPRAQIRLAILKGTSLGSTPTEVLQFIETNLKPKTDLPAPKLENHGAVGPTAKGSDKKGVGSIRVVLGAYQRNPGLVLLQIPLIVETTTAVQWAFDKDGKLIEVFVDKDTELGDRKSPDD
jgi:hypothetical protein